MLEKLWDWLKRLFGFHGWKYDQYNPQTRPVGVEGVLVERKRHGVKQPREILRNDGTWGELCEESRAFPSKEAALDHVNRLDLGIPRRWPVVAGLLALVGVVAGIVNAINSFGGGCP